ncbi:MAG: adenosine deaminase [Acidobacteria bacterium]|nr:adenosine deaminase [Acidobacteriota bacterium]
MGDFLQRLPKAELHVHLEGSIEPETLRELAPSLAREAIDDNYACGDFPAFMRAYEWVNRFLRTPDDYALITRRLLGRMERENVRYAEINLSAGVILWKKQDLAAIDEAVRKAAEGSAVQVRWIWDAVRQWSVEEAMRVAEMAAERLGCVVAGLGLGGDETRGPAGKFAGVFAFARRSGLHLAPHGGEITGPESVWAAVELGAERIGHGIGAARDPRLLETLRARGIPLEICITSNVVLGAVQRLEDHPVRRIFDAGVPITLNTDDPGMFRTTLTREYEIAAETFGFSDAELERVAANGFRYAFSPLFRGQAT